MTKIQKNDVVIKTEIGSWHKVFSIQDDEGVVLDNGVIVYLGLKKVNYETDTIILSYYDKDKRVEHTLTLTGIAEHPSDKSMLWISATSEEGELFIDQSNRFSILRIITPQETLEEKQIDLISEILFQ